MSQDTGSVRHASDLEVVWDLQRDAPDLHQALAETRPWVVERHTALAEGVPVGEQHATFDEGRWFRPPGHSRAFYERGPDGDVLACKGSEVLGSTFPKSLDTLRGVQSIPLFWHYQAADYFVLVEKALPMALCLGEALEEARRAAAFQAAHVREYGEVAAIPLPVQILRVPDEVAQRADAEYQRVLSPEALAWARRRVASGLAVYVYYLPTSPLRLLFLRGNATDRPPAKSFREAMDQLAEAGLEAGTSLDRWHRLVARMLLLGFMPSRLEDAIIGGCLMWHNTTVEGGFCDVASLRPLEEVTSDKELFDCLNQMMGFLGMGAAIFLLTHDLVGPPMGLNRGWHFNRYPGRYAFLNLVLDRHTRSALRRFLASEARPGLELDPRIASFLGGGFEVADLERAALAMYPSLSPRDLAVSGHWLRTLVE